MRTLITFLVGVAVGYWLGKRANWNSLSNSPSLKEGEGKTETLIERQGREKEAHKASMLELLKTNTPLTNDHIEQMLGVSDATATRYLEELEKEGKVRQVGKTGRGVRYERIDA